MDSNSISLKITQASLNQTALDWPQNMANVYEAIRIAASEGSDMVLMPELCLTGYEVNDDFQRTDNSRIFEALHDIAALAQEFDPDLIVSIGHPWRLQFRGAFQKAGADPDIIKNALYDRLNRPFNAQTLMRSGQILGMTAKMNLYSDGRGYENRYFNEWSFKDAEQFAALAGLDCEYGTIPVTLPDGGVIPFGRPLYFFEGQNGLGYVHAQAICEEKWVATYQEDETTPGPEYERYNVIPSIARHLGTMEGILLEIPNASPPARLKQDVHIALNNLASNFVGAVVDTDGLGTSGATYAQFGHRLISQNGETISSGQRLRFGHIAVTTSIIELRAIDAKTAGKAHKTIPGNFKNPGAQASARIAWQTESGAWDAPQNPDRWKEELIRAQALWMFDYMRKTKANGIVEALSGGKDSSFNCAMVRVMVELAMTDLGVEGFCAMMAHLPYRDAILEAHKDKGREKAVETCMTHMLTAVYMRTDNSSGETRRAARTLILGGKKESGAEFTGIGGQFVERNMQDLVDFYGLVYAVEDTTSMPPAHKTSVLEDVAAFLNAAPHDNAPEDIKKRAGALLERWPEIERITGAAMPGQGITYENIQARCREVLALLFANAENKMAVANPNLDEAYGAYATFGGDLHSGTVNWNGGIHKTDQETVMRYLEERGVSGVMAPLTALYYANQNRPTAELQPKKDGKVAQYDEDALQGTFEQKMILSRLTHHTWTETEYGSRRLNAGEIFARAKNNAAFQALDDNALFNALACFYERWEGPAQHKIHASPIAPTYGESVDKQTSLRTPNLSGGSRDEIVELGLDLMFQWAREEGMNFSEELPRSLKRQSWQDKSYVNSFIGALKRLAPEPEKLRFNLSGLYEEFKAEKLKASG